MKGKSAISRTTFINSKVTSTISVALVLFLLGLIVLLALLANNLSSYVKENLSFSVILTNDMKESDILKLQKRLDIARYTKSTEYISKEKAAAEMEKELGENPETFLGYNPFLPVIEVKLKSEYANTDSIAVIEKSLRRSTNISDVSYQQDLLNAVNKNMKKIGTALSILAVLLLLISFALINNTIRLMIYSKRFLIHTMRLVGATNSFIRKPFVNSNILMGIIAAIIACAMIFGLVYYNVQGLNSLSGLMDWKVILIVSGVVLIFGILISIAATCMAVNKYLRTKSDDLHYI